MEDKNKKTQIVEPTGVVLKAQCEVRISDKCSATIVSELDATDAITAVWTTPGRTQVNVCGKCLQEKIDRDEWKIGVQTFEKQPFGLDVSITDKVIRDIILKGVESHLRTAGFSISGSQKLNITVKVDCDSCQSGYEVELSELNEKQHTGSIHVNVKL